jgi:hypothetical protein
MAERIRLSRAKGWRLPDNTANVARPGKWGNLFGAGMTRATGIAAVMAQRAPDQVEADDARTALYRKLEFFPTPPWAARAGGELIRFLDPQARPDLGAGLRRRAIWRRSAMDFEASWSAPATSTRSASARSRLPAGAAERRAELRLDRHQPAFQTAAEFVRLGLRARARRGAAAAPAVPGGRKRYLAAARRRAADHGRPFAERVPMTLGRWDPAASTATGYAWFVWMKGATPRGR